MHSLNSISQANTMLKRGTGALFALFVIITAINAPPKYESFDYSPFWGPLQRISDNNRLISIGFAVSLIALGVVGRSRPANIRWGWMASLLLTLHLLIFIKNCFSIGLSACFLLVGLILLLTATWLVGQLMVRGRPFEPAACWWPLVLASFGFLAVNVIQYQMNSAATMQISNRFHGITSNPQMYALTTAIVVPTLLFQYTRDRRKASRLLVLLSFLVLLFFSLLSGSRLSLLLSVFSVLMYFRSKVVKLAAFAIPLLLLITVWVRFGERLPGDPGSHITSTENTRSQVWKIQLQGAMDSPLFGEPLAPGERAGFGENSFLAAGFTLGLPGLGLAIGLALAMGRQILALIQIERRIGWRPELALPIAMLSSCLVGAFFEAFLLGIFTFPLTALMYTVFVADVITKKTSHISPPVKRRYLGKIRIFQKAECTSG